MWVGQSTGQECVISVNLAETIAHNFCAKQTESNNSGKEMTYVGTMDKEIMMLPNNYAGYLDGCISIASVPTATSYIQKKECIRYLKEFTASHSIIWE
jgi:hypothetical protein